MKTAVLVDARKIHDGGIGTYIRNLVAGLVEISDAQVGMICRSESDVPANVVGRVTVHIDDTPCYSLRELFRFPKRAVLDNYDVFHVPHFTLPFGVRIPTIITVHDLIHVTHPQRWYYPHVAKPLIKSALRRATRVIAVSQATRDAIADLVKNDRSVLAKTSVIQNGIESELVREALVNSEKSASPYLFSVCSTPKPHKGLHELIEAFALFKSSGFSDEKSAVKLFVAGAGAQSDEMRQFAAPLNGSVQFLGEVPRGELAQWYAGASAVVVPSRAEGFALPVIEAQALRVPVVATPVPAIEELMTSRDVVAEDFSTYALARAMRQGLHHESPSAESEAEYGRHLARFDRKKLAEQIFSVYAEARGEMQ